MGKASWHPWVVLPADRAREQPALWSLRLQAQKGWRAGSWSRRLLLAPAGLSPDWRGELMWLESWLKNIVEMPLALLVVNSRIDLNPYAQRPALCTLCVPMSVCAL